MTLAIRSTQQIDIWSDSKLAQIKEIYGKGLSVAEFDTFVQIGRATNLNPFLREIWAVKYGNNPAQIFIGRDGYRKSAQASPNYDYHHVDAVYNTDEFHFDMIKGEVHHHYNFKDRGKLMGAYCLVKRRNSTKPIFVFVEINEYNKHQSVWKEKPATMIKKVAEAQSLRMAFQELFAGTYDESETWNEKPRTKTLPTIKLKTNEVICEDPEKLDEDLLNISQCESLDALQEVYTTAYKYWINLRDKDAITKLIKAKDVKKMIIEGLEMGDDENAD